MFSTSTNIIIKSGATQALTLSSDMGKLWIIIGVGVIISSRNAVFSSSVNEYGLVLIFRNAQIFHIIVPTCMEWIKVWSVAGAIDCVTSV